MKGNPRPAGLRSSRFNILTLFVCGILFVSLLWQYSSKTRIQNQCDKQISDYQEAKYGLIWKLTDKSDEASRCSELMKSKIKDMDKQELKLKTQEQEISDITSAKDQLEKSLEMYKKTQMSNEEKIQGMESALQQERSLKIQAQNSLSNAQDKIQSLQQEIQELKSQIEQLQLRNDKLQSQQLQDTDSMQSKTGVNSQGKLINFQDQTQENTELRRGNIQQQQQIFGSDSTKSQTQNIIRDRQNIQQEYETDGEAITHDPSQLVTSQLHQAILKHQQQDQDDDGEENGNNQQQGGQIRDSSQIKQATFNNNLIIKDDVATQKEADADDNYGDPVSLNPDKKAVAAQKDQADVISQIIAKQRGQTQDYEVGSKVGQAVQRMQQDEEEEEGVAGQNLGGNARRGQGGGGFAVGEEGAKGIKKYEFKEEGGGVGQKREVEGNSEIGVGEGIVLEQDDDSRNRYEKDDTQTGDFQDDYITGAGLTKGGADDSDDQDEGLTKTDSVIAGGQLRGGAVNDIVKIKQGTGTVEEPSLFRKRPTHMQILDSQEDNKSKLDDKFERIIQGNIKAGKHDEDDDYTQQ
eukprot:TRINITY_DN6932_c0_g2_i2.p1 TRINITY_DN6932_c0_g2~~TRINITY_DN6932_c0_g2_i2.p1  ORF type:complete len:577 (-),score=95.44 TRINITY_DN6932_c0_g2_i2:505-2235(-)